MVTRFQNSPRKNSSLKQGMSLDVLEEAFAEYNISDSPLGFKGWNTTIVKRVNVQTITLPLNSSTSKIFDGFFDSVFHSMQWAFKYSRDTDTRAGQFQNWGLKTWKVMVQSYLQQCKYLTKWVSAKVSYHLQILLNIIYNYRNSWF